MLIKGLHLTTVQRKADVGMMDELIVDMPVDVTPGYAEWLASVGDRDPQVMQLQRSAVSAVGSGAHAVQWYVVHAQHVVRNLIEKGVPVEVAHQLLPHELYKQLYPED